MKASSRWVLSAVGFAAGLAGGLLGAGGGLILLPVLRRQGLAATRCHATVLAVTVPLAVFSGLVYLVQGRLAPADLLPFLPGGLVGAAAGSFALAKLDPRLLRLAFAGFLAYSGLRFCGILELLGVGT